MRHRPAVRPAWRRRSAASGGGHRQPSRASGGSYTPARMSAGPAHQHRQHRPPTPPTCQPSTASQQAQPNASPPARRQTKRARPRIQDAPARESKTRLPARNSKRARAGRFCARARAPLRVRKRKIFLGTREKNHFPVAGAGKDGGVKNTTREEFGGRRAALAAQTGGGYMDRARVREGQRAGRCLVGA